MLVFPPKNDCSMERLKQLEVMRETESPLDSKLQVVIGGGSAVTNEDLQGGCSLSSLPYQLGYTECTSEEESRVASQQLGESMVSQREFFIYPSETSQVTASSISNSTDSEYGLYDPNLSTSTEQSYPISTNVNDAQLSPFQAGSEFAPSFEWTSGSSSFATRLYNASSITNCAWDPSREPTSPNPPVDDILKESWQIPLNTPHKMTREHNQAFDRANGCRLSTRTRAVEIPPSPIYYERQHPSAKLATAQASQSSTSPNIDQPKASLKRAHNQVEKQYRNRLNGHFATLLSKIPAELAASSGIETGGKIVSKAETLALAERYIEMLQEGGKELMKKNKRLEEDYDRLRKAWIESGGVLMP